MIELCITIVHLRHVMNQCCATGLRETPPHCCETAKISESAEELSVVLFICCWCKFSAFYSVLEVLPQSPASPVGDSPGLEVSWCSKVIS